MDAKTNIIRLISGAALLASVLAAAPPAASDPTGTTSPPKVFVHLRDSTGAPVPGACFTVRDEPLGERILAEECDGPDGIFAGDGVADGTVAFAVTLLPANYAVYTITVPDGYAHPAPGLFTMGTVDVHVVMTIPGDETAAPSLLLPEAMVVNATSPSGAAVAYQASATDSQGNAIAVSCTPPSGSTFPIGITVVSCSATDHGGRTAHGEFPVTVRGAGEQLASLLDKVRGVGPGRSLAAKLRTAQQALGVGDVAGACSALRDFLRHVETHTGKSITPTQAEEFTSDALRIAAVIGCP